MTFCVSGGCFSARNVREEEKYRHCLFQSFVLSAVNHRSLRDLGADAIMIKDIKELSSD